MEFIGNSIKGIYRDILKGENNQIIFDSGWLSNVIVNRCRLLLAGFIKNDTINETFTGIQYLQVGKGVEEWDKTGAPAPDPAETTALENPCDDDPFPDLEIVYLDENDVEVPGPTNRLQITATLGSNYPVPEPPSQSYPLREFGLFGSFNNVNYMIDCIRHPVIHKDVSATLIRVVRLYF